MLVEIDQMTEGQVKAFVAGPLTRATGAPCRFEMVFENEQYVAYIFIGDDDRVGCCGRAIPGFQTQEARDDAATLAVNEAISDTGFPAVWAVYLPDTDFTPNARPEFKSGACWCGDCTWYTEDIYMEFPVGGGWYRSWPCGSMPEGTYCSDCGSLLGPGGWALLAGRDPKDVQWPEGCGKEDET